VERVRLKENAEKKAHWRRWGPYLSERQWATVREDYSENGDTWNYFTHDQARMRAYRWGEDGIGGICDNHGRLCLAFAFWNEEDPILKERLFGLTNPEGNHGEDVKEYYYYLDNTPTHSYMQYLYKYPFHSFPYDLLIKENAKRSLKDKEYELIDTGIFQNNHYFDIFIEYAKKDPEDYFIRLRIFNRGQKEKTIHVLPTFWFRNTWNWEKDSYKPQIKDKNGYLHAEHNELGSYYLYCSYKAESLFTENETNRQKLLGKPNLTPYVKDAFHEFVVHGKREMVNPKKQGSKAAFHATFKIAPTQPCILTLRLCKKENLSSPFEEADVLFRKRKEEADEFYKEYLPVDLTENFARIQRQAFAGLLWNKQFYHFALEEWLKFPRKNKRNGEWVHLYNDDILSVPDKWEYPCFFSWDSAFHALPLSLIDPEFAKKQLTLLIREWYMHPNGQIPAYEWNFSDVNPPVHAWASWRVYKIEQKQHGKEDRHFLESAFQKLLLNFTWWVNRKDVEGKNVFQGGFLGLDNISVFNRNDALMTGAKLYQSDATSWMGMYCLNMLAIALELAHQNPCYEDMASKFFEHFLYIADAINYAGEKKVNLWNEEDGFYYDMIFKSDGSTIPLMVRSMVGIIPLFAVMTLPEEDLEKFKGFKKRLEWFLDHRIDLCEKVAPIRTPGEKKRRLLSIVSPDRLKKVLRRVLDEKEFLSPFGIRSLSKYYSESPFSLQCDTGIKEIFYESGESSSRLFGGNSNWRGPIWFPLNILIIESLQKYHHYLGDTYKVECPTGSGKWMTLWEISLEISRRLLSLFTPDKRGIRPFFGAYPSLEKDPHWKDHLLFYEYFNAETGQGLGASHQTGWTALISKLILQLNQFQSLPR